MINREDFIKEATVVNLIDTFNILDLLEKEHQGYIISRYSNINGISIFFRKSGRSIQFSTAPISLAVPPVEFQNIGYGILKPFKIKWKEKLFTVKDGAGKVNFSLFKGLSSTGELWEFDGLSKVRKCKYRAMIPLDNLQPPVKYFLGNSFKIDDSIRAHGLIKLSINSVDYSLFDYAFKGNKYLFIECAEDIDYDIFMKVKEAIFFCFALLSGNWLQNEEFIFQSDQKDFSNIIGYNFRRLPDSIESPLELVNPKDYKECFNLQTTDFFSPAIFSQLVELSLNDQRIFRSIKLIVQAAQSTAEIQASVYCVALETVKTIIMKKNESTLRPMPDKKVAKEVRERLKSVINALPDDVYNNKNRLLTSIDNINQVGNTEGFYLAFEKLGIPITDVEKKYLSFRNKFLHGEIPFDNSEDDPHQFELHKTGLHIYMLTCCLILKLAGYSGHIMNFWEVWELKRGSKKSAHQLFKFI